MIPIIHPTILAPAMTPISPAKCPILCRNFSMLMQQVRTLQSQPIRRNNSMSRTGSRTALIWTRPLSLPSAGAFPQSVQLKGGKLLFLNWIFAGVESYSLFDSPSNRKRGSNVDDVLCVPSESLVTLVQEYQCSLCIYWPEYMKTYAETMQTCFCTHFLVRCLANHLTFNYLFYARNRFSFFAIFFSCVL